MKKFYTTGQVAQIIGVAARTVTKWFDRGELMGWKMPDSNDRRISHDSLLTFAEKLGRSDIVRELRGTQTVVLVGFSPYATAELCELLEAAGSDTAVCRGTIDVAGYPNASAVICGPETGRSAACELARFLRARKPDVRLVVVYPEDAGPDDVLSYIPAGFTWTMPSGCTLPEIVDAARN